VRLGSFAAQPVLQTLPPNEEGVSHRRMFVPVRGDTSITMIDIQRRADSVATSCYGDRNDPVSTAPSKSAHCDDVWRITRLDDPDTTTSPVDPSAPLVPLPDEPYAMAVDDESNLLYVGHLRGGSVSLIELGQGGVETKPEL